MRLETRRFFLEGGELYFKRTLFVGVAQRDAGKTSCESGVFQLNLFPGPCQVVYTAVLQQAAPEPRAKDGRKHRLRWRVHKQRWHGSRSGKVKQVDAAQHVKDQVLLAWREDWPQTRHCACAGRTGIVVGNALQLVEEPGSQTVARAGVDRIQERRQDVLTAPAFRRAWHCARVLRCAQGSDLCI
jgi:hypothetical protein